MTLRLTVPAVSDYREAAPELDLAEPGALRTVLLLAGMQRTGTTLLGRALGATGLAGVPAEYLSPYGMDASQPSFVAWRSRFGVPTPTWRGAAGMLKRRLAGDPEWFTCHRWRTRSVYAYLDEAVARRTTPNGVFAVSAHANHHQLWEQRWGFDARRWGVPVHWVHVEREDRLAQAVSFVIALQTHQFVAGRAAKGLTVYDADGIERRLEMIRDSRDYWRAYFPAHGIEPLYLTYERLTTDYESVVRSVLALLGEEVDEVPPPQVERQANQTNREWIERFTTERPEVVDRLGGDVAR